MENGSDRHGSIIAGLCYEHDGGEYRHKRIGKLIFYRSEEAQVRLDMIPAGAWTAGVEWFIGNFEPSDKVQEPPFIDGDLMATTEDRGDPICVGHIHTRERNSDGAVQYYCSIKGIPVREWKRIAMSDKENKSIYLKVRMD